MGTATGAEVQSVLRRTTPRHRKCRALVQSTALAVYDGHDRVGVVIERNREHLAITTSGKLIGTYATRTEAMRAFPTRSRA